MSDIEEKVASLCYWHLLGDDVDDYTLGKEVPDTRLGKRAKAMEQQIIPLYYHERSADDLPGEWLGMVKRSIRTLAPRFCMRRMVKEYVQEMYLPALPELEPS